MKENKAKKTVVSDSTKSIMDRIKKNSSIRDTAILSKSKFFNEKDMIQTPIPIINVALSGKFSGGLTPGLTLWAGPSKHFKTAFALLMAKSYMDKYPDSVLLFYDSEFGTPIKYFDSFGIDKDRVLHTPLTDVEELKFDIMQQLKEINRDDKIIIIVDSIGNLASKKEVEDALDKKSVSDMTRAKQIKSLFRMVTPHLAMKDIPMICIAHIYMTMEMFSKAVVSGGTGQYYSADNIFIIGRQQQKDKEKQTIGFDFIINVEKSRYVKEKSKIPVSVSFDGGISRWSGLLELALESGHVIKPKNGYYSKVNTETGEIEEKQYDEMKTNSKEFWLPVLRDKSFSEFVQEKYCIPESSILAEDINDMEEV